MYIDRASCKGVKGAGVVLKGPDGLVIEYTLRLVCKATNNITDYGALSKGLDLVRKIKPKKLNVYSDS